MASHSPLNNHARTLESWIAYEPPVLEVVEDSERGQNIPYEDRWADEIFTWLSSGRTLLSYCSQPSKPARSLVISWIHNADGAAYTHLRERVESGMINRAFAMVDDAGDIAEEPLLMGPKGFLDPISMADKRARVEAKLRLAALLDPIKFSPTSKVAQNIALTQVNITNKNVENLTDDQLARVLFEFEKRKSRGTTTDAVPTSGDSSAGTPDPSQRQNLLT